MEQSMQRQLQEHEKHWKRRLDKQNKIHQQEMKLGSFLYSVFSLFFYAAFS